MAPSGPSRIQLWQQYIEDSQQQLSDMEIHLAKLKENPASQEDLRAIEKVFHNFAGSGALYGAPGVSSTGGEGEYMCYSISLGERPSTRDELEQIDDYVRRLRVEIQAMIGSLKEASVKFQPQQRGIPLFLIVSDRQETVQDLATYIGKRGIQVESVTTFAEARSRILAALPDLAVVSVALPDGSGYQFVRELRDAEVSRTIPVLLLGESQHFMDKVEAIHCGADGFVNDPPDPATVFKRLKSLLARRKTTASRVLAVEDDPSQGRFLEEVLTTAGFTTKIVGDPTQFETELHHFKPNLILMDVNLPKVTGYDLVRFLRQEEGFLSVPVIFLTVEGRATAQIKAIEAGGDDYLIKPVKPDDLVATIRSRLVRYRSLQEMMDHDELTSLLAHIPFLQQARLCLSRFSRRQEPYAMVLIQIDQLDSHVAQLGPQAKDALIQGLAKFVQRRVRQTDIMGRYGDNLIALVLEHLTDTDAVRLMLRLQREFAAMDHSLGTGRSVRGTFSVGVAMAAPMFKTLKDWIEAASEALKHSRRFGGNKTCVAGHDLPETE